MLVKFCQLFVKFCQTNCKKIKRNTYKVIMLGEVCKIYKILQTF